MRRLLGMTCCALGAVALVACSSSPDQARPAAASSSRTACGTTHTAAGVPVVIEVSKGSVSCGTALSVADKYATMVRDGQVKGNGGGAPVSVSGWTCQGYPTPEVLGTGDASRCTHGSTEILAVLPAPSASAGASPGGA